MNVDQTQIDARAKLQRAIDRATARAIEQAEASVRPVLNRSELARDGLSQLQRWTIASRTTAGTFYNVTLIADADGLRTECSCPAGQAETPRPCWHRALARRAALPQAPHADGRPSAPGITLAALHGRPTRNVMLVDEHGNGTAPDPWPADLDDAQAFAAVS